MIQLNKAVNNMNSSSYNSKKKQLLFAIHLPIKNICCNFEPHLNQCLMV